MKLVDKLTEPGREVEKVERFVNALNIELLQGLMDPKNARKEFFRSLFDDILELAISAFDFGSYYFFNGVIREFYKQTLAHNKDLAPKLLRQILNQAPVVNKYEVLRDHAVLRVLRSLVEELSLVDTPSLEAQTWLEMFVKAYITMAAGKEPSKPEDWARPAERYSCYLGCKVCPQLNLFIKDPKAEEKSIALTYDGQIHATQNFPYLETGNGVHLSEVRFIKTSKEWEKRHLRWKSSVEAAREELRQLPKLKQVLGDKYNGLIGSTAQPPAKRKGEDTIDAGASKRARGGGENRED
ncbi:hypothetical protein ACHAPX_001090 [Trichoderma viride]